jgi:hypothetical protein
VCGIIPFDLQIFKVTSDYIFQSHLEFLAIYFYAEATASAEFTSCLHDGQIKYSPFACEYLDTIYSFPQEGHACATGLSQDAKSQFGYFEHP